MRAKEFTKGVAESLLNENVTELYHGTLAKNVPSILANGLNPTVGEFTRSIYANKAKPLVFAADASGSRGVYCSLVGQMHAKLGITAYPPSAEDVAKHCAILVISKDVGKFRQYNSTRRSGSKEPTDYTSQETIHIDRVITGKELLQWIKTHNADRGEMCPIDNQQGVAEGNEPTFNQPRRQLNIPELIKRGAIFVTHPHGPNGWETDRPDWDFSLITLQNVLQKSPDWVVDYKKYINKDKKLTQNFINKLSDQKYQQILWSIQKLGIPDNVAFLDQQGVTEAPLPPDWDPEKLNLRQTFKNRIKYAVSKAQRIGAGSSRVAFIIPYEGRNTVLKVAKNLKGLAQNEAEIQILDDWVIGKSDIVIPLIDYDKDNNRPVWLQTEMASQISMRPLLQLLHTPTLWFLTDAIKYRLSLPDKPRYLNKPADLKEKYFDPKMWTYGGKPSEQSFEMFNEYVDKLSELKDSSQIELGDLQNNLNWGQFMGRPVVIDLGLSSEVWSKYYILK